MSTTKEGGQEEQDLVEIKKTIIIDASPEIVFKAITDPRELTNWFPDQAILEPRVGGKMRFSFFKDPNAHKNMDFFPEGVIVEITPNKKISYTWEHLTIPDFPKTVVTWELEKIDENKTKLKLIHTGFKAGEKMFKEHNEGWTYFLGRLENYCKKRG
ncbi:MAG: SRPBCC domain-containing protein [Nitrososphaeraceae archaeon]